MKITRNENKNITRWRQDGKWCERKAYMALYARAREAITGGIYRWGGKLPSKRAMAERYGVSVITVEHAYALLAEEGYVEPRERSGYFIIIKRKMLFPWGTGERK